MVQVLTHNNQTTLEKTLQSLKALNSDIVVIDHGSIDGTLEVAGRYGRVVQIGENESRSEARNRVVKESKSDWHLYLEPGEVIKSGHAAIANAITKEQVCHRIIVSQGDVVTKPIRLWHRSTGLHFSGPCYESLHPDQNAKPLNVMVFSNQEDQSE